jgi:hypothetical protein
MANPSTEHSQAATEIDAINHGLRGPVIDIIKRCVPEFRGFTREELFERIMNTPELAALCFKIFRANPSHFEAVLIGPDGKAIVNDNEPLSCGRTLAEVIAMVVRAVARRYMRATLDGKTDQQFSSRAERQGLVQRAAGFFGLDLPQTGARPPAGESRRGQSLGDRVYRALYDFLLFEWQVQLIPEYATIPLDAIPDIGPYLYGARDVAAVRALMVTKKRPMPKGAAPIASGPPSRPVGPTDSRSW